MQSAFYMKKDFLQKVIIIVEFVLHFFPVNSEWFKILFSSSFFLVGWGANSAAQSFGEPTTKAQLLNLVRSIRTVAKSMLNICRQI